MTQLSLEINDCEHEFIPYICDAVSDENLFKNLPHRSHRHIRQIFCRHLDSLCVRCGLFLSMNKDTFILYKSFYNPIKILSDEDMGKLFRAIMEYQIDGTEPATDSPIYMPFAFMKNQFRVDREKYDKIIAQNQTNGLKGGRPKTQNNPTKPNGYSNNPNDNDNGIDNVNVNDNALSFDRFWDLYDKKVGDKVKIEAKFNNLPKSDIEKIFQHVPKYKLAQPDKKFRKDPSTYLNNKSWNDEIISQSPLSMSPIFTRPVQDTIYPNLDNIPQD
jgi:hypothetical protein